MLRNVDILGSYSDHFINFFLYFFLFFYLIRGTEGMWACDIFINYTLYFYLLFICLPILFHFTFFPILFFCHHL